MKMICQVKILIQVVLFSLLLLNWTTLQAQHYTHTIDFERDSGANLLFIWTTDTTIKSQWQIGHPNKTLFNAAKSEPNVISTGLKESYVKNDTSIFYLYGDSKFSSNFEILEFDFYVDCDTLNDLCKVEILGMDSFQDVWINPLIEDTRLNFQWIGKKPVLGGTSDGWQKFHLDMSRWIRGADDFPYPPIDGMQVRFTFISDSIETNQDGWMIDNLSTSYPLDIQEVNSKNYLFYPNPSNGIIQTEGFYAEGDYVDVVNSWGTLIKTIPASNQIDISDLPAGCYFLHIRKDKFTHIQKIAILK